MTISVEQKLRLLIMYLLHDLKFLKYIYNNFNFESYRKYLGPYEIIFEAIFSIHKETQNLPTKTLLENAINLIATERYSDQIPTEIQYISKEIVEKFFLKDVGKELSHNFGLSVWKNFISLIYLEDTVNLVRRHVESGKDNQELIDEFERSKRRLSRVYNLGKVENVDISSDPLNPKIYKSPTKIGHQVLDYFTSGFISPEVCIVLAPSGVGKTLLSVNACVDSAEYCLDNNIDELSVVVSYEASKEELEARAYSCAARIPKDIFTSVVEGKSALSKKFYKEYENLYCKYNLIKYGVSEEDRLSKSINILKNVKILEFNGIDGKGFGGIEEIAVSIEELQEKERKKVRIIFIDWAGLAVDRYMDKKEIKNRDAAIKSSELRSFVERARSQLSAKFNCSVWITHQLSGAVSHKGMGYNFDLSDAADSKTIHQFADFGFIMSPIQHLNIDNIRAAYTRFICKKARRSDIKREILVRLFGEINRVVIDPNVRYDFNDKQLVVKSIGKNKSSISIDVSDFGLTKDDENVINEYITAHPESGDTGEEL